MFKALREKLLGASKQAEEELDPKLNLDYETFRPEERESGAVIRESHLENVLWEMELALLQSDVAMEALEEMKAIIKKRLVGLRVENRSEIVPTIEKALKASLVELLSKNVSKGSLFASNNTVSLLILEKSSYVFCPQVPLTKQPIEFSGPTLKGINEF